MLAPCHTCILVKCIAWHNNSDRLEWKRTKYRLATANIVKLACNSCLIVCSHIQTLPRRSVRGWSQPGKKTYAQTGA